MNRLRAVGNAKLGAFAGERWPGISMASGGNGNASSGNSSGDDCNSHGAKLYDVNKSSTASIMTSCSDEKRG